MGWLSKMFSENDENPKVDINISGPTSENLNKDSIDFSDNDPELMKDLTSTKDVVPDKKLPFSNACPYCGFDIGKPIKRKRACPECKRTIYVRTTQDLYPVSVLTDEQVNHADFYMALKSTIYITMSDYKNTESNLKKKWNKTEVNTYDILWSLYNNLKLYQRHIDKTYDKKFAMIEVFQRKSWLDEAAARYQGNRGNNPTPYLKSSRNNSIQMAKLHGYTKGLTVRCYDCCEACMKFDNKTFSLSFLSKTSVLPIKTCTRPFNENSKFTFCNCTYQSYYSG